MDTFDARTALALYEGIVDGETAESAIAAIARRFGCQSATIVSFDPLIPGASIAHNIGAFDDDARRRYDAEFAVHDPAPRTLAACPSGTVFASNRLFSEEYLRRSLFLHEFLRPMGIEETLGGVLSERGGRLAFLTVHRGADRAPFGDPELASLEVLMPHMARALQLRRVFGRLQTTVGLLSGVVDRLSMGVVVLGGDGSSIHVNRAMRAMVARNDGLRLDRKGRLRAVNRTADGNLARYLADSALGGAGGVVRIPRRDDRQPYAALVAPAPASVGAVAGAAQPGGTLFVVHDPDAQPASVPDVIAAIFGVPMGAARLIAALAKGEDLKAYAERNAITYDTVRYHLKTAYAHTGVNSQARLMQIVTRALTELEERDRS